MSLAHQFQRAVRMPPREIAVRLTRKVVRRFDGVHRRSRDVLHETYAPEHRIPQGPLTRIIGPIDVSVLNRRSKQIAALAEHILKHRFNLLGSGWVSVQLGMECQGFAQHRYRDERVSLPKLAGHGLPVRLNRANVRRAASIWKLIDPGYVPIDWQRDFKSGYRWSESTWYRSIHYGDVDGADVKVPWELARMQHLPQLAWAYALARSGEPGLYDADVYRREFCNQVLDFTATNPPRFGVNWCCTMDVAIRAANWLVVYDLFRAAGAAFEAEFDRQFRRTIYEHGVHIESNLEWDPVLRGNHYLADVAGLLFVGAWLSASEETDRWLRFAFCELIQEVSLQFHEDGSNFEASTNYHRLSAEMAAYATAVVQALPTARLRCLESADPTPSETPRDDSRRIRSDGGPVGLFPRWYWQRLERMGAFTAAITRPDGSIPQIGDNDSGRFLKLWPCFQTGPEGVLQEDHLDHRQLVGTLRSVVDPSFETSPRLIMTNSNAPAPMIGRAATPEWITFPDFGLYVYRTSRLHLVFRCGSVGQRGNGGHAHNDQLSFELWLDGRPVLVDPGTYVYTALPEERNRFRSTAMHNTLSLAGREQNTWHAGRLGLFSLQDQAQGTLIERTENSLTAEHYGFGIPHRRTLQLSATSLRGVDTCEAAGAKKVVFHFAPDVLVHAIRPAELEIQAGPVAATLISDSGPWRIFESRYSRAYGEITTTKACSLAGSGNRFEWEIRFGRESSPLAHPWVPTTDAWPV